MSDTDSHLKDVHTEHCCIKHGCKYGRDLTCTVVQGYLPASFPDACEVCQWERDQVGEWMEQATDAELLAELQRRNLYADRCSSCGDTNVYALCGWCRDD